MSRAQRRMEYIKLAVLALYVIAALALLAIVWSRAL